MKNELTPYQIEALDYSANILLTANAGSGKTFVLAKRFVEILLDNATELENIVAITFTDKAAGELNKRIALEIDDRLETEPDQSKRKKLENARRQLVSANISTIHSFCINILKEFAPEAGIDVSFSPIDQNTSDELIELSVYETVNSLISDNKHTENVKYLVRLFGSKSIVLAHLTLAIHQRKNIDEHLNEIYNKSETEISDYYQNEFSKIFVSLFDKRINDALTAVSEINRFVLNQPKGNETAGEIAKHLAEYSKKILLYDKLALLRDVDSLLFTQKGEVKNKGYLSRNRDEYETQISLVEGLFSDLRQFIEIKEPEAASLELARFGKIFTGIYEHAKNVYSNKKHQKGYLDFEDILLFAGEVLKLAEVKEYLSKKFKYIMIDEYQDTNEIQYKIFMPVLDNLKHGNLFVVGDEKQSIYMFRDADLRIFNQTKTEILNSVGGRHLNLPHSFRMAPQLVLFTNKLFGKLFDNPRLILNEVEYNGLVCAKPETGLSRVEILLADKEKEVSEAEFVAAKIIELISGGEAELKEIGILCRKRSLFAGLENEFVKKNIPYSIVGGKGFYQRQTIYDIHNYLSFIINKDDDAALIGILRAPFYNLSDVQLFEISLEEGDTFYGKLKSKSISDPDIKKCSDQLEAHIGLGFSSEIYSLIRNILLETGYWAVIASKKNADQEIANLEKLLVLARSFSQKSFKNLYDFTVSLRESIETMEDEGQAQISQDENTVKLLTIHQAKGLEYKAVFLYGCNGYSREDSVKAKGLSIDKDLGFLAKVPLNNNYFANYCSAPVGALYNYISHKKTSAEIKRLLYVAVTRAKNYLFISATHKDFKPHPDSFFQLVCEGLSPDFNENEKYLSGDVNFMKGSIDNYDTYDKNVELRVKIIRDIPETDPLESKTSDIKNEIKFITKKIKDIPEKEIISATKISMFTQCPVKYELTYDLGYSTIYNLIKQRENNYVFNSREEDELKSLADVKGRVIHNILKDSVVPEDLEKSVENYLTGEMSIAGTEFIDIKSSIINDLNMYYKSETYRELSRYRDYKNELEVYCVEGEHYLFGIIDKLINEKDKLIIVDYKTDDIEADQIKYRAENYFPQLKFYAYILGKLYPGNSVLELRLIFLKHPEEKISFNINRNGLEKFGIEINSAISKIISSDYKPNLDHCGKCHFALEGNKCVKLF